MLKQERKKRLLQRYQQHKDKLQKQFNVCKEEADVALVVSRAAWWVPLLASNNNMQNLTFAEALKDFLQNVSFHCYGKLVETGLLYQERLLWLVFHVAALATLIMFICYYLNTGGQQLTTTMHDPLYPIRKVQFPAVSICSINRISNASALRYAEELNRKDPEGSRQDHQVQYRPETSDYLINIKTYPLAYEKQQQLMLKQERKKRLLQRYQQHKDKLQKQFNVCKEEADVALVVSRAAWWVPLLASNNNMQNLTFAEALKDFLQNVSFHCYGKLVETGLLYQERLLWLVFHVAALATLIMFICYYLNTGGQQLTTTMHDPLYPIRKVQFPAVSICSINRISNASALRYAEELNRKDPEGRGVHFFYEQIKILRYNYYVSDELHDYQKALAFQRFLDLYDREDTELFYDTRKRMAMLTPNCSDILVQCRLGGDDIKCAEEFKETITSRGLCCSFNTNNKYAIRSFRKQFFGEKMGLTLLLRAPQKDNFYKMFTLDGFIVGIYSPMLYPNHLSGGIEENFALTGTDTYFSITARVHETVSEALFLGPKARNCLFNYELPKVYGNSYTLSNCITLCRIRSVFVLCGCMLFQTSFNNISKPTDAVFCSLQHKECLMRYDFKWFNVITQRQNIRGLEREMEDSLYCPDCLPSCSETRYNVQIMGLPLNQYNIKAFVDHKQNYSDLAVVHIYFGKTNAIYFKRILVSSWFEIFSYVGNICGIITGFSLIGICEIVFFIIQQFLVAYKTETQQHANHKVTTNQNLIILP